MIEQTLILETRLTRNPDLVSTEVDGETVMMDVASGHFFGLDPVGTLVWETLSAPTSVDAVARRVREAFDAGSSDDVEADMLDFLTELLGDGLVTIANN